MPKIPRGEKLNMLLRDELAKIIDRTLEFPEGVLVTLTHVRTSSDLRYAAVFFSLFNGDGAHVLELLEKNVYHIQQQLNKSLRMRPVPKIRFAIDEEEVRREAVEQSLARIKREETIWEYFETITKLNSLPPCHIPAQTGIQILFCLRKKHGFPPEFILAEAGTGITKFCNSLFEQQRRRGEAANAGVCKTPIRGCKSRRRLDWSLFLYRYTRLPILENLRVLCPNCHSLKPTHRGRNRKNKVTKKTSGH